MGMVRTHCPLSAWGLWGLSQELTSVLDTERSVYFLQSAKEKTDMLGSRSSMQRPGRINAMHVLGTGAVLGIGIYRVRGEEMRLGSSVPAGP